jgi:hypothetical protein
MQFYELVLEHPFTVDHVPGRSTIAKLPFDIPVTE